MNIDRMIYFTLSYIQYTHENKFYRLMEEINLAHGFYLQSIKGEW